MSTTRVTNYPELPCSLLADAYRESAERNVLAALNPKVFFGYFSVCADGIGHGNNTTFPALDWGQTIEALLWLGRTEEVLASWNYVRSFQREDGLLPIAIMPDNAGKTIKMQYGYSMTLDERGALWKHWWPGNPLLTLANVTFLQVAEIVFALTKDKVWLKKQMPFLTRAADWLMAQITSTGMVRGGAFYVERPSRLEYDGINQCATFHVLQQTGAVFETAENASAAKNCRQAATRIQQAFREYFWAGEHSVEYIHPEHGCISSHGLTDVDWAAVATGILGEARTELLWKLLQHNADFLYDGIPTGLATCPETYEDWEMQYFDRHDLSAMGRVWYFEAWARWRMNDREGLLESVRQVARKGQANGWHWMERYYSERTGDLGLYHFNTYVEYPSNLIRIVNRFVLDKQKDLQSR